MLVRGSQWSEGSLMIWDETINKVGWKGWISRAEWKGGMNCCGLMIKSKETLPSDGFYPSLWKKG